MISPFSLFSAIRKHASILSALAVLCAAAASPYLVPVDPDSALFRSGVWGALLLISAYVPVRRALTRHTPRSLLYGAGFAFILALCLGLGSELFVYDRLLAGGGSLVRRLAVPVLATPMLGALCSHLFSLPPVAPTKQGKKIPGFVFFLIFSICYGVVLLAFFPGVIAYDFEHEIAQYQSGVFEAAHPVFHTLLLGTLYRIGEALFGTMTAGACLYSAVQLLLLALMYAAAMSFVQKRVQSRLAVALLTACFALLPFHGVLAVSTAKDPLFAGLCVLLCVQLWSIAEAPDAFLGSVGCKVRFSLCSLGMALLRHNGIFAFLPACAAVILLQKRQRKRALLFCGCVLAFCFLVPRGLEALVHAEKAPSSELMSVPCQQLMRTAERAELTDEEFAELSAWFSDATHRYNPHCADAAKGGNFDFARYQADPGAFWAMYVRYGLAHPRIYLEAFLENSAGIWYPGDTSHAHAIAGEGYDYVYLRTDYLYEDAYPMGPHSLLPAVRHLLYESTHNARHEQIPLIAQLFCPATYSFILLFATLLLCFRQRRALALCTLPAWGIALSLLFSAGIFVRYAYPIMAIAPVLLVLSLAQPAPGGESAMR